ncbi:MAG: hypothetical protein R8G33_07600 [Gammaproteobacteria bacterium]|nr:hypothetical protein [Gammaproteobacteria bacterium]
MKYLILIIFFSYLSLTASISGDSSRIIGSSENDTIIGTTRSDQIYGGMGDDSINGGFGDDILYGGPGADTFVKNLSHRDIDIIMDYSIDENDSIVLSVKDFNLNKKDKLDFVKDIELDIHGNLNVLLEDNNWHTHLKIYSNSPTKPNIKMATDLDYSKVDLRINHEHEAIRIKLIKSF